MSRKTIDTLTSFKGRTLQEGDKVKVYRNLHNGAFSIKVGKYIVAHAPTVHVKNAVMQVDEKKRQSVIKNKVKEVHAYITGYFSLDCFNKDSAREMYYNPYKVAYFTDSETETSVQQATSVLCVGSRALYNS